ncbi:MAG: amidohydrolase, partial [Acidobacteriota bacterium]
MHKHPPALLLCLVALALSASCTNPAPDPAADTILVNGKIITVDANDSIFEALAIRDGKILALGTSQEMEDLSGPQTRRIDLQGRTATPGLLDAHCHFVAGGMDLLYELELSYPKVRNVAEIVVAVKNQMIDLKRGEWVLGRGWDEGKLTDNRYVYASDLDPVSRGNPVWLTHTMGHYGVANSTALEMAGISAETPDPPGGTIDRDAQGNPTGVLKESAQSLVRNLIPAATPEQMVQGILRIVEGFNSEGMTGLKDPGIGERHWDAYRKVLADGALNVRVFALWRGDRTLDSAQQLIDRVASSSRPYESTGDDHLISGGVKLYIDGSGGARTAWLHDEWNKDFEDVDSGNRGYPVIDPEVLRQQIRLFHEAGMHVSVHSIGDRAIDWVVDSYEQALQANPRSGMRHGIIHNNIPSEAALDKIAQMQSQYDA